jgi:hypothetical protein
MKFDRTSRDYTCSFCEQSGAHYFVGKLKVGTEMKSIIVHRGCIRLVMNLVAASRMKVKVQGEDTQ